MKMILRFCDVMASHVRSWGWYYYGYVSHWVTRDTAVHRQVIIEISASPVAWWQCRFTELQRVQSGKCARFFSKTLFCLFHFQAVWAVHPFEAEQSSASPYIVIPMHMSQWSNPPNYTSHSELFIFEDNEGNLAIYQRQKQLKSKSTNPAISQWAVLLQ